MKLINWIRKLDFSQRTRYGSFAFVIVFLITIASQRLYIYYSPLEKLEFSVSPREKEFIAKADSLNERRIKYVNYKKKAKSYSIPKTKFDPNKYTLSDWKNIGLSEKQAQSIINSTSKGFEFRRREDVRKLYVVSDKLYHQLKPWIDLPDSIVYINNNYSEVNKSFKKDEKVINRIIEINSSNQDSLVLLKGIGDKFSNRILKYRDLLGGFSNLEQLKEVYGLPPEVIEENKNNLTFDTSKIKKININSATVEEIKSHPYFDWKIANLIVKYRISHGDYSTVEDVKQLVLIDDELYEKIKDYISTE